MSQKLQKVLAAAGLGSRRQMETWIRAGRVLVNHQAAFLGQRVHEQDIITVDGKRLQTLNQKPLPCRVMMYHKPVGEISTRRDPEGRPTVFAHLPHLQRGRWIAIGRLDINTSGLLLFTTEGELANRLMHPSYRIEREYAVRVRGAVDMAMLKRLRTGVHLVDGIARFEQIQFKGGEKQNQWYHVVLREGRTREVRRLWESQGVQVSRLIRVRYGLISLPYDLSRGKWQELDPATVQQLRSLVNLPSSVTG